MIYFPPVFRNTIRLRLKLQTRKQTALGAAVQLHKKGRHFRPSDVATCQGPQHPGSDNTKLVVINSFSGPIIIALPAFNEITIRTHGEYTACFLKKALGAFQVIIRQAISEGIGSRRGIFRSDKGHVSK
jgi:hypothetical protein